MYLGKVVEVADTDDAVRARRGIRTRTALLSADAGARPRRGRPARADRAGGRRAVADRSAVRLPLPPALPAGRGALRLREPGARARAGDPSTHLTACHFPVDRAPELLAVPRAGRRSRCACRPEPTTSPTRCRRVDVPEAIIGRGPGSSPGRAPLATGWRIGCAVTIALIALFALAAPLLVTHRARPERAVPRHRPVARRACRAGRAATFLLGTDELGRDVLVRMAYGARVSLLVGRRRERAAVFVGVVVGLAAG